MVDVALSVPALQPDTSRYPVPTIALLFGGNKKGGSWVQAARMVDPHDNQCRKTCMQSQEALAVELEAAKALFGDDDDDEDEDNEVAASEGGGDREQQQAQ